MKTNNPTLEEGKRALRRNRRWRRLNMTVVILGVIAFFLGQIFYGAIAALLFAAVAACLYRITELRHNHWQAELKRVGHQLEAEKQSSTAK
jgi:hypothetical protein